jgi:D-amino peptidase
MKLYISCDMEGSTGVVSPAQVTSSCAEYEFGRRMQLHDALAVVEAAHKYGAERILVNDAHGSMTNLDAGKFPKYAELISGSPKILGMVEGVGDFDVAFFVGYHAMAGTEKAILDHTYSGRTVYSLKINGLMVGETGFNAMLCGAVGVPVALVAGDQALCFEAQSFLGPNVVTCALKEGHGRVAARVLPPERTAEILADGVRAALDAACAGKSPKVKVEPPYHAELTFLTSAQTDAASLVPGSERIAGRTLVYNSEDIFEVLRFLSAATDIAAKI